MPSQPKTFCPYVGLQPYTEAEREYFFGRERDIRVIVSNLYAAPLTVLYGASGVGKSSILLAGVLPKLRATPRTTVIIFRDWQDAMFLRALKATCLTAFEQVNDKLVALDANLPLDELLAQAAQALNGSIVIILDQFEEYFTYHPESRADNPFEAEFARAVNHKEINASFLLALREDGLSKLDRFRTRIPNLLGNTLRLQHLDRSAAEAAIREPLRIYNARFNKSVSIEDDLVSEVIKPEKVTLSSETANDDNRVETPLLQLVMTQLWEKEMEGGSTTLRMSTLQTLGGKKQIVQNHLNRVMELFDEEQKNICVSFFDHLVTPDNTKIALSVNDLNNYAAGQGNVVTEALKQKVSKILMKLDAERVLRSVDSPTTKRYEIFHDVLAPAVLEWRREYIAEQARVHAIREEAERQEQKRKQERDLRRKTFTRIGSLAGVILLLIFGALTTIALQQSQEARSAQAQSEIEKNKAVTAEAVAVEQRQVAFEQRQIALSREVATYAQQQLATDSQLSLRLAIEAARLGETTEAENVLRITFADPERATMRGHNMAVFSPDGTKIISIDTYEVLAWDARTAKLIYTITPSYYVFRVELSPDGKLMLTTGSNAPQVWEVNTGKLVATLEGHKNSVMNAEFSRDNKLLVTASRDGTAKIWDTQNWNLIRTLVGHQGSVWRASFSPDSQFVVTAGGDLELPGGDVIAKGGDGVARVWNVQNGDLIAQLVGHQGSVIVAEFSPDGKSVLTAGADGTARIWNLATGTSLVLRDSYYEGGTVWNASFMTGKLC